MPEMPAEGYAPYRLWGRLPDQAETPAGAGTLRRLLARIAGWLLGYWAHLLYVGITCRAGYVRWAEHSDTQAWARDVSAAERDESTRWPTLHDAVRDRSGRIVLVVDYDDPECVRPARPDERIILAGTVEFRGDLVPVYRARRGGTPARSFGRVIEGARTGERRMIHSESPVHNIEHNEGNARAVNRRRRVLPRHLVMWRRQAMTIALWWLAGSVLLCWVAYDGGGVPAVVIGAPDAVTASATLILLAQIARRATRGRVNVTLQRSRTRRRRATSATRPR